MPYRMRRLRRPPVRCTTRGPRGPKKQKRRRRKHVTWKDGGAQEEEYEEDDDSEYENPNVTKMIDEWRFAEC